MKVGFVKDKRGDDPRLRYYATKETLEALAHVFPGGLENPELVKQARDRIQPLLDEISAAEKAQEEKRLLEIQEKEREK